MSDRTQFTDDEIETIRYKFFRKLDLGLRWSLPIFGLMCLVMPYLPGRRGKPPMIERMDYTDAVIMCAVVFTLAIGISWIWQNHKYNEEFRKLRAYMRKKKLTTSLITIGSSQI